MGTPFKIGIGMGSIGKQPTKRQTKKVKKILKCVLCVEVSIGMYSITS